MGQNQTMDNWKKIEPGVWKPEKDGDEFIGVLVKSELSTKYDKNYIYSFETKEGHTIVYGSAVLDDKMKYVKVGQAVKIVFKGMQKNAKKQDTKIFEVSVKD